jgi:hypothetical protein
VAVLPDIAAAGFYGLVLFLLVLGVLVIFVEKVSARRLVGLLLSAGLAALVLATIGEMGLAFLAVGFAAALLANQAFEWLTTR